MVTPRVRLKYNWLEREMVEFGKYDSLLPPLRQLNRCPDDEYDGEIGDIDGANGLVQNLLSIMYVIKTSVRRKQG